MIKIGVCGSSGSGKGHICKQISAHGYKWIDTDRVYRDLATPKSQCVKELKEYFGDSILNEDGSLNRKELSKSVFEGENSKERLNMLNKITHFHIQRETERIILESEKNGYKGVLIDAPVLFESGFDAFCDVTLCITAPTQLKIDRIMKRDGITYEKAISRINNQLSDDELRKKCDYEIDNSENAQVEEQINELLSKLKNY
ncbi:MAG: dephospho-CoA kinase [Clostridia bacterium]|nr:dephospho-CoA kinase [Clostridia bacterium]